MSKLGKRLIAAAKEARALVKCGGVQQRYDSVWDAIEPSRAEAANMKARAETMIAIQRAVSKWRLTQAATAKRLGVTRPRLNDLLRGRINKFSLDALVNIAMAAGLEVRVAVVKAA